MPLPSPVGEHWDDHSVTLASGLVVTFRVQLIDPETLERLQDDGLKRAADRIGDRSDDEGNPLPVTVDDILVEDVARDYFDNGIKGYYTSKDSTLVPWDATETQTLFAEWPDGMRTDLFWKVHRFARSGRVSDPKAD